MSTIFKSEGIVFRSLKYSETSLILDIYTKESGLHSFIVSGVRKSKSKMANVYHPMNIIDIVSYVNNNSLSRIKEGSFSYSYIDLNFNIIKSSLGMFMIDLARQAIKEKEVNEALYKFLVDSLKSLDVGKLNMRLLSIQYAIKLASFLGFALSNNYSTDNCYFDLHSGQFINNDIRNPNILNGDSSKLLHLILSDEQDIPSNKIERNYLLDQLITYYKLHVESFKRIKISSSIKNDIIIIYNSI